MQRSSRVRAYEYIRDNMLSDPRNHGGFLTEDQVAAQVGLSRTPVREAFILLAAEGLLQLVPRHGAYVPPVTTEEIDEVLQLRAILEVRSAEAALQKGRPPLEPMELALERQVECSGEGREREFSEWDNEFHLALVRAAGNSLMTKVYADLRGRHIRIGVRALGTTPDRKAPVIDEHRAILEALRSGDVQATVQALLHHIDSTAAGLRKD